MELILRARRTYGVWRWRLRYWWLDTPAGRHAQLWAFALLVVATILQLVRIAVAAVVPPPPGTPRQAIWWVVQLIILVVSAAISYAMRPKTEKPKPAAGEARRRGRPGREAPLRHRVDRGRIHPGMEGHRHRAHQEQGRQEMTDELIVTTRHLFTIRGYNRRAGFCRDKSKAFFRRHGLDWRAFVRDGIAASQLEATATVWRWRSSRGPKNASSNSTKNYYRYRKS